MGLGERPFRTRLRTQLPTPHTGDVNKMSHDARMRERGVSPHCEEIDEPYLERKAALAATQPFRDLRSVASLLVDFTGKQKDDDYMPGMYCVESSFIVDENNFFNERSKYIFLGKDVVTIREVKTALSIIGAAEVYRETQVSRGTIVVKSRTKNGEEHTFFYSISDDEYLIILNDETLNLLTTLKKTAAEYAKSRERGIKKSYPPLAIIDTLMPIIGQRISTPINRIKHSSVTVDPDGNHQVTTTHHHVAVQGEEASIRISHAHWIRDIDEPLSKGVRRLEKEFLHTQRIIAGSLIQMKYDNDQCTEFLVYDRMKNDTNNPLAIQINKTVDLHHPENLNYIHGILLIGMVELMIKQDNDE